MQFSVCTCQKHELKFLLIVGNKAAALIKRSLSALVVFLCYAIENWSTMLYVLCTCKNEALSKVSYPS